MKDHPGRCIQALHRVQSVLAVEFDDLTPPDVIYVLSQLIWTYHSIADRLIKSEVKNER